MIDDGLHCLELGCCTLGLGVCGVYVNLSIIHDEALVETGLLRG